MQEQAFEAYVFVSIINPPEGGLKWVRDPDYMRDLHVSIINPPEGGLKSATYGDRLRVERFQSSTHPKAG